MQPIATPHLGNVDYCGVPIDVLKSRLRILAELDFNLNKVHLKNVQFDNYNIKLSH
jgi:hypothetical protein